MRKNGRSPRDPRPLKFTPHVVKYPHGSVIVETGDTKVLCTVTVEEGVPHWMRAQRAQKGWLTAEYAMLPSATHSRSRRERAQLGGRTQEIQRLIGRALRGVIAFELCPDMTFLVDCDVLQADGGTRTAAITGSSLALELAIHRLMKDGKLKANPLKERVAAVSVGMKEGQYLVDLDYDEDSSCDLDMNLVMTESGRFLEIQGTGEKASFTQGDVTEIMELGASALRQTFALQRQVLEQ